MDTMMPSSMHFLITSATFTRIRFARSFTETNSVTRSLSFLRSASSCAALSASSRSWRFRFLSDGAAADRALRPSRQTSGGWRPAPRPGRPPCGEASSSSSSSDPSSSGSAALTSGTSSLTFFFFLLLVSGLVRRRGVRRWPGAPGRAAVRLRRSCGWRRFRAARSIFPLIVRPTSGRRSFSSGERTLGLRRAVQAITGSGALGRGRGDGCSGFAGASCDRASGCSSATGRFLDRRSSGDGCFERCAEAPVPRRLLRRLSGDGRRISAAARDRRMRTAGARRRSSAFFSARFLRLPDLLDLALVLLRDVLLPLEVDQDLPHHVVVDRWTCGSSPRCPFFRRNSIERLVREVEFRRNLVDLLLFFLRLSHYVSLCFRSQARSHACSALPVPVRLRAVSLASP